MAVQGNLRGLYRPVRPQKRAAYDRFGHAGVNGGGGGGGFGGGSRASTTSTTSSTRSSATPSATCSAAAAAASARAARAAAGPALRPRDHPRAGLQGRRGRDRGPTPMTCETCEGSGAKKGAKPTTCGTCGGQGRVRQANGFFQVERTCPRCGGAGQLISARRHDCHGHGQVRQDPHPATESRPASTTARASAWRAKATRARAAARAATSMSSCRCPARTVRARQPRPAVHRAGADDGRRPWAARSRRPACAAPATASARPRGPRGRPDRQDRAHQGQGHAVPAAASAATWWSSCSSRPRPT
jgi:hypothetical protein